MAKTAQERAQERVDQLDERIAKVTERRDAAVAKTEERYKTQLAELKQEREHAANAPALKPQEVPGQTAIPEQGEAEDQLG